MTAARNNHKEVLPFRTELLAPAGSIEALKAAYIAGADAVYIGGSRFGARAYADNPDETELCAAIDLAHRLGRKLYMTVNTLVKDTEVEKDLEAFMTPYVREGLDGVIVQDFGIVDLFQNVFPELPLHASTQMSVTGVHGARFLKEIGMTRIVPARELSLDEIRTIHTHTGMEIESFIHGAMCYSYSGQCLMSSLIGGRSGNRGRCAGVCRLPFDVYEDGRLLTGPNTRYPLNMKDMNTVEILPDMIRAGISSFKIEGRMKKPEYTAGVVSVYRKYIDLFLTDPDHYRVDPADLRFLWTLFNRDGFNQGCYYERNGRDMIALKNEKTNGIRQKAAHDLTEQLRTDLSTREARQKLQSPVKGSLTLSEADGATLTLIWSDTQMPEWAAGGLSDSILLKVHRDGIQKAAKRPVSEERVRAQMQKTGTSDYYFAALDLTMEENLFVPMQLLNELRREGFEELSRKIRERYQQQVRPLSDCMETAPINNNSSKSADFPETTASVCTLEQLSALLDIDGLSAIWLDAELFLPEGDGAHSLSETVYRVRLAGKAAYLMLPYVMRKNSEEAITSLIREYVGLKPCEGSGKKNVLSILARNLEELGLLRDMGLAPYSVLDSGIYTMNSRAEHFFARKGYPRNTASLELNAQEFRLRDNSRSELIVYGRAPMMLSTHCLKKTMDRCNHANARLVLRDRRKAEFPAECHCFSCYNIIYNSLPLSLLRENLADARKKASDLDRLRFRSFRLQFTDESGANARTITTAFLQHRDLPEMQTTRGHFRRGVE